MIGQREDLRKSPGLAIGIARVRWRQRPTQRGGDVPGLIAAAGAGAIKNAAVVGVGDYGVAFTGKASGLPVAEGEDAFARPSADADAAAVLLRAIEPVGEAIVGCDVIDLGGGLVVPGAPCLSVVHADDGTLVAAEHHALAVSGVDPDLVVVVAARSSLDGNEGFAFVVGDDRWRC